MYVCVVHYRLPKHFVEKMRKYREVNWSEVIRKTIESYLNQLEESKHKETGAELLERLRVSVWVTETSSLFHMRR